jgi:phage antirepressor YoqD-like protein
VQKTKFGNILRNRGIINKNNKDKNTSKKRNEFFKVKDEQPVESTKVINGLENRQEMT